MHPPYRKNWTSSFANGLPIAKDGCGVFGIIRKKNSPKLPALKAIQGISSVSYRGSNLGAGYASFNCSPLSQSFRVKAFVSDIGTASKIEKALWEVGSVEQTTLSKPVDGSLRMAVWEGFLLLKRKDAYSALELAVDRINLSLVTEDGIKGRIFSSGKFLNVYKEVGYPLEVARLCKLDSSSAQSDAWIAHTRQPTNSPGELPIWSHPFASSECAIVHNGDISSFGANAELLNSWGLRSHVGTDSEVAARILDHLIRVEKLSIEDAANLMTNPYEGNSRSQSLEPLLSSKLRGARLDGPFAIVAGYCDGRDTFLIALIDRSKFRPLLIGEDSECFYIASEESQIRNISPKARIWAPEAGSFFIASVERGLIASGLTRERAFRKEENTSEFPSRGEGFDISGKSTREINEVITSSFLAGSSEISLKNARGERFIGIGISMLDKKSGRRRREGEFTIKISGYPGNCLANLNDGATFEIYGNAADNVADTMHAGRVIIHGSARDVLGQAMQGGEIFIQGSVGNRAAIQLRQYKDSRSFVLVGETADDYLGEYMGGGVVCILNLSGSSRPTGNYVGTGMVGGTIYVRGDVSLTQTGLLPHKVDVLNYLAVARSEGAIPKELFDEIESKPFPSEPYLGSVLPRSLLERVRALFFTSKYTKSLTVEKRVLTPGQDGDLQAKIAQFFRLFSLSEDKLNEVLSSKFTIICAGGEEKEVQRPVPPQEVPIEE